MEEKSVGLSIFKKAQNDMVAKNAASWDEYYSRRNTTRTRDYTLEEIDKIINSGSLSAQQKLSRNYYDKDGFYKRIILYYATILKYNGLLVPNPTFGKKLSQPHIQKRYYNALEYVERLGLPEMLTRMSIRALIDGCYYGLIQSLDKDKFTVIDLPSGYCCSRFKDFYGNDIVEFDTTYFYTIIDKQSRESALANYPKVVSTHFKKYDTGKVNSGWVTIPADIGICFPFFEDGRPLFLNVIPATIQYDDAVDTERERELEEIRKIIVQKIPHLNDGQLLFEPEEAVEMHAGAVGMMKGNKNLSILTTYADVDAIISKTSADTVSNSLEKMNQNIFAEAGASAQIFAPTGTQALSTSITNDMALMMILGNKYSRFISYILNILFANSNINFSYELLPISYYNQSDYIADALKLAQSGYSFLLPAIGMGLSQRNLVNIKSLENDVLNLREVLIPLSSSYTQSGDGDGEVGAPEKDLEDKAEKTIQNEDAIDNQGGSD